VQCRKKGAANYGNKSEGVAEGSLEEGVNDPHIFKAIAMIGPMGAGKSTIARQLVGGSGLRSLNLDNFNELLIKQGKVAGGNLTPDQLERSWQLTQAQKGNWVDGRLGLLIDGSGRNVEGLVKPLMQLEALGYDTMVILVNVSLETSLQRQQSRAAQQAQQYGTGRNVPADLAKSSYDQIQQNIPKLQQLYGNKLLIINNEGAVDLTQEKTIVDRFLSAPPSKPAAVEWIKSQGASQGQQLDKRLAQQQRQQSSAQRAPTYKQQGVAEDTNAVDINQIASQMKFLPTTKLAKQYKFVKDGIPGQMPAMTYTVSNQEQPVVTVTSDGKETQNVATPTDVIMSGPSKENYVVKAAKFPKLYQGTMGGPVVPEQSPRLVALYAGKAPVTFTAPWGESMILKPGDYLVKDGDAGYYRIAKLEYDQTYNKPGSNGQQGVAEDLSEEFDLIENIIEGIAAQNGVDAEVVWADLESLTEDELYAFAVTSQLNEDWQKANKRDKTDGMSQKAVNAYRRENPGSKLKTAVTTKPSKLKKGSKASKRRKSYCSRSRGQMKMHSISCAKTPDKAICKARRRWNC
jgi:adenylate kinase family enzyme